MNASRDLQTKGTDLLIMTVPNASHHFLNRGKDKIAMCISALKIFLTVIAMCFSALKILLTVRK